MMMTTDIENMITDMKIEKAEKRKVKVTVFLLLVAVSVGFYLNTTGISTGKALAIGFAAVMLPVIVIHVFFSAIAVTILRKSLSNFEYNLYFLMGKDPEYLYLTTYPDQEKIRVSKENIKRVFNRHKWMKRFDIRVEKEY